VEPTVVETFKVFVGISVGDKCICEVDVVDALFVDGDVFSFKGEVTFV
jgi:hypothetical protein